jgi:hypothetical protein
MSDDRSIHVNGRPEPPGFAPSLLYSNYTAAGIVVAVCAIVYLLSLQMEHVPAALAQGIQPASFPQGVVIAILTFTLMMLVSTRNSLIEAPLPVPALAYKTMAAMIGALAITTWVDFFAGLIGFTAVAVPMWGHKRWSTAIAYGVLLCAVLYLLFSTFLQVNFPHSSLSSLLR